MTVQALPWSIQGQSHEAPIQRNATAAMFGAPVAAHVAGVSVVTAGGGHGVVGSGDLAVTQNGTPNMSVNIAAGRAIIRNGEAASILGGCYAFLNDATVNVAIATADGTNPRIDLVVAQVRDANYSGASNDARLTVVTGTPAASPAVPSLTSYPNCVVLAQVAVAAAAGSIVTANITDKRTFAYALGGTARGLAATPPSGASLRTGLQFFETDTYKTREYNGATLLHMARKIVGTNAERLALPAAQLFEGLEFTCTDTDRSFEYTGTAWVFLRATAAAGRAGIILTDAAQTITTGTNTDVTWGTEVLDPDGWTSGGSATLTVPSGWDGRYAIHYKGAWSTDPTTARCAIFINGAVYAGEHTLLNFASTYVVQAAIPVITLAAGATIKVQVFHAAGSNRDVVSRLEVAWLGA